MGSRNFSPDDRPPVRFMETEELAYVAMRAREVHDFWHTLFGLPTNLIGESALKVIEFEQMYLPMCLMSVVGGTVRFTEKQRKLFFQHYFPWAIRAGMQSTDLMCVYYEKHFQEDLEDVRRKWGITPAPAAPNQNVPWPAAFAGAWVEVNASFLQPTSLCNCVCMREDVQKEVFWDNKTRFTAKGFSNIFVFPPKNS